MTTHVTLESFGTRSVYAHRAAAGEVVTTCSVCINKAVQGAEVRVLEGRGESGGQ